jgi:hypothetical protein
VIEPSAANVARENDAEDKGVPPGQLKHGIACCRLCYVAIEQGQKDAALLCSAPEVQRVKEHLVAICDASTMT